MPVLADANLSQAERQALQRLVAGAIELYGGDLEAIWLYGSRARGESQHDESDIDAMVVTRSKAQRRGALRSGPRDRARQPRPLSLPGRPPVVAGPAGEPPGDPVVLHRGSRSRQDRPPPPGSDESQVGRDDGALADLASSRDQVQLGHAETAVSTAMPYAARAALLATAEDLVAGVERRIG